MESAAKRKEVSSQKRLFLDIIKLLRELASISRILKVCGEKADKQPEYCSILLPFLKEKVSDELNYAEDVKQFLSRIVLMLTEPQPTSPGYRLQLLERSDLAKTLFLSIAALEKQPAIKLLLLQTLQMLSSTSDMNCTLMLSVRGAESICLRMNEPDPSGMILFHSSEILWNLLESGNKATVAAQLSSVECAMYVRSLTRFPSVRQNSSPSLVFWFGFDGHVFSRASVSVKSHHNLVGKLKLTYNMEDLQMKKLLLNLLVVMSRDPATIPVDEQVILALLTLAKPPATPSEVKPGSRDWSSIQLEELQLQALAVLATVAPLILDHYMSCYGNVALLHLLDWCVRQDGYCGQGHSFHATGGRGSKKAHMRYCIRLMRSVTSLDDKTLNQDLCDQGTIHIAVQFHITPHLTMFSISTASDEDAVTVEMKSDMQIILSALCESDMHRKELFGTEGVEMTVHYLRRGASMFYSGLGHNKLLLSTLACVTCIVGCYTTEDCFLTRDGVLVLLDLLSSSPKCVHGVILATLLELCDNLSTIPHILSWSDSDGWTAPSLLLQVWRREEEELGVSRNQHGGIVDDAALMSTLDTASAAVLEMQENLIAKIYLIFCFEDLPGLSVKDRVTLSIVKRYLDFKVSEVWDEISRELIREGIRPVTPDQETLRSAQQMSQRMAEAVVAEQEEVLRQHVEEANREEQLMYEEVRTFSIKGNE
uniref:Cilia- and flagella-associated protein 69 ARM repeats domain-containing protein n=1 Tax=Hippocampus comes TaxID=109280 RepID=A0A3Q2YND3_HIPCM